MHRRWLIVLLLMQPGCKDDAFFCTDDDQCMQRGAAGICQSNELCSFPSDACPSGQAYGEYAGTLAGRCVDTDDTNDTGSSTDDTVSSASGETGGSSATTEPGTQTSNAITTGLPPESTTTDRTTGADETSSSSTSSETGPDGPPNGSTCQDNADCASDACYSSILGAVCGECLTDADCEFGCTPPYPLDPSQQWAVCNGGDLGDSCETSAACVSADLMCVSFANIAGLLSISTCSECATTADCPGSMLCNEFFNASELRGGFACTNPGSLFDGSFCTVGSVGEAACMSHCAPGNYMGLFNFGVCSECAADGDCPPDMTCRLPELDLEAGTASTAMCE